MSVALQGKLTRAAWTDGSGAFSIKYKDSRAGGGRPNRKADRQGDIMAHKGESVAYDSYEEMA